MAVRLKDLFYARTKILVAVSIAFFLLTLPLHVQADRSGASAISFNSTPVPAVLYFYGDGCVHCENIRPFIDDLVSRYPGVNFRYLEVHNTTNAEQLAQIYASHNISQAEGGTPTLVVGDAVLIGELQIRDEAEQQIIDLEQGHSGIPANITPSGNGNCPATITRLNLALVISCALVDSINPCGLAVLVFLLITMTAAGSRRRILVVGGAYIFATFLFHLFVGIGLFSIFSLSGLSKSFSVIGGLIAILFGAINIVDLLGNKETFFLSIPESHKGLLGDYIRRASLPAAFILGILAGILGFTCTGGIYISILGLMGQAMTVNSGIIWLILYNLVFILPLLGVTILVAYGIPPEHADRLRTSYKRSFRAVISLVLIALGTAILLGWMG